MRQRHQEATGYENLLPLGLIGLAYGFAELAHAYGFLAVFAAGLALALALTMAVVVSLIVVHGISVTPLMDRYRRRRRGGGRV